MYQLEWAQGILKVGPSILPLSTSTLISSLFIQKAARVPSSPSMKTPQPENIPLKKGLHTSHASVDLLTLDILEFRIPPLFIPSENVAEERWELVIWTDYFAVFALITAVPALGWPESFNISASHCLVNAYISDHKTLFTILRLILPLGCVL